MKTLSHSTYISEILVGGYKCVKSIEITVINGINHGCNEPNVFGLISDAWY